MTTPFRRIVTGHDADNRAIIVSDGAPTRVLADLRDAVRPREAANGPAGRTDPQS